MTSQHAAIETLLDYSRDPKSRIVILRGATGVGKTWVIQQFYDYLQKNDDYWPALEPSNRNFLHSRKELRPPFEAFAREKGVLPGFGWWTFNCEELFDNSLSEVAGALDTQIKAHLPYLLAARSWRNTFSPAEMAKKAKDLAKKIAESSPAEALSLVGVTVPFTGLVLESGAGMVKTLTERAKTNAEQQPGRKALQDVRKKAQETAAAIADVATLDCPSYIVVEDIHRMPESLGTFIDDTLECGKPITVIATQWPESDVVQKWLGSSSFSNLVEYIDIDAPSESELVDVLLTEAPRTSPEDARKFVQPPLNNPLMLKWWLELPYVRFEIELDHRIAYSPDLIPTDALALMQQQWQALPEVTRSVLEFSAATAPRRNGGAEVFPRALIVQAIRDLNIDYLPQETQEIEAAFNHAVSPAEWCSTVEGIQSFTEPDMAKVALEQADVHFRGRLKTIARQRLAQQLEQWIIDSSIDGALPHEPLARLVADWLIALEPVGSESLGAAYRLQAEVYADRGDFTKAEHTARSAAESYGGYLAARDHMERFARAVQVAQPQPKDLQPAMNQEREKLEEWARANNYDMLGYSLLDQAIKETPDVDDPEMDYRHMLGNCQQTYYVGFGSARSAHLVEAIKAAAPGIERILARERFFSNVIVDAINEDQWFSEHKAQFDECFQVLGPEDKRTLSALDSIPVLGELPQFFQIPTDTLRVMQNAAEVQAQSHPERAEDLRQLAEAIAIEIDLYEMYPDTSDLDLHNVFIDEQKAFGLSFAEPISREALDAVIEARRKSSIPPAGK